MGREPVGSQGDEIRSKGNFWLEIWRDTSWAVGHQWTVEREIIACRAKARLTIYRDSGNTRLNINILAGVKKPGRLWCVVCGIRSRP